MPPVRADPAPKLANAQAVCLDNYCGVDAQYKSVFENEHKADIPQKRVSLLDPTGKTIHTFSRLPFGIVLMIPVETGRMKNSLSRGELAQNERILIFAWQSFYHDEVSSSLKSFCAHLLTNTSFTVALPQTEQGRLLYRATINNPH